MAEQLLDGADVAAGLEEVGGERVPEGVAGDALRDARELCRAPHGLLEDGLVEMVSEALAGDGVQPSATAYPAGVRGPSGPRHA